MGAQHRLVRATVAIHAWSALLAVSTPTFGAAWTPTEPTSNGIGLETTLLVGYLFNAGFRPVLKSLELIWVNLECSCETAARVESRS